MSLTYRYVNSIFPNSGFENPAECYSLIVWSGGQGDACPKNAERGCERYAEHWFLWMAP
jgi:hypothetical protein